jgi:hypothetical protein
MGKQISFYMTPEDEQEFLKFVQSERDVVLLTYAIPTADLVPLKTLPSQGEPFWLSLFLWDRQHSPPPVLQFVPSQGYYIPNEIESELIKLSRSHFDQGRLVRGRIWAEMIGWSSRDPANATKKGEAFRAWFDLIGKWIKRESIQRVRGDFLLPGAARFADIGGSLCQAVLSSGEAL